MENDCWVGREGLSEEVPFKLSLKEQGTSSSCGAIRWKSIPAHGNSKGKGPEQAECNLYVQGTDRPFHGLGHQGREAGVYSYVMESHRMDDG